MDQAKNNLPISKSIWAGVTPAWRVRDSGFTSIPNDKCETPHDFSRGVSHLFRLNGFSLNGCGKGRAAGLFCHLIVELRKPRLDRMAEP